MFAHLIFFFCFSFLFFFAHCNPYFVYFHVQFLYLVAAVMALVVGIRMRRTLTTLMLAETVVIQTAGQPYGYPQVGVLAF